MGENVSELTGERFRFWGDRWPARGRWCVTAAALWRRSMHGVLHAWIVHVDSTGGRTSGAHASNLCWHGRRVAIRRGVGAGVCLRRSGGGGVNRGGRQKGGHAPWGIAKMSSGWRASLRTSSPVSEAKAASRAPSMTRMLSSPRGCTCGMTRPQGAMSTMVCAMPRPIAPRTWAEARLAARKVPPGEATGAPNASVKSSGAKRPRWTSSGKKSLSRRDGRPLPPACIRLPLSDWNGEQAGWVSVQRWRIHRPSQFLPRGRLSM